MSDEPRGPSRRRQALALTLVLLAAGAVRLVYAEHWPSSSRFFDERFNLANVRSLIVSGTLQPANGYYPLASYLPQTLLVAASDRLYRASGDERFAVLGETGYTAAAYRWVRRVQVAWGVAGVWLLYLVGRRLFDRRVGLAAALILAFSPWHIHSSGYFKPDVMLTATVLLCFLWSLRTIERPTTGRYLAAGAGVALATSSKLTGGLAALAPAFLSLVRARREPRRLLGLAAAGAAAIALFGLLNPYWRLYLPYFDRQRDHYALKAATHEATGGSAPEILGRLLLECFGWPVCLLAIAGAVALVVRTVRAPRGDDGALGVSTLLVFPPAFAAVYLAATPWFKANNLLPIEPYVALIAAWAFVAAVRRAAPRLPPALATPALAGLLLALLVVPRGVGFIYRTRVPTAEDVAIRFLDGQLRRQSSSLVVSERLDAGWPWWEHRRPAAGGHTQAVLEVASLGDLSVDELHRADGVLFRRDRLVGKSAGRYLRYVASAPRDGLAVFRPEAFRVRGPAVVAVSRPWRLRQPMRRLTVEPGRWGPYRLKAAMPASVAAGEVVSFMVWLPARQLELGRPRLAMGSHEVELLPAGIDAEGAFFLSPRLLYRQPGRTVWIDRPQGSAEARVQVRLYRWLEPSGEAAATAIAPAPPSDAGKADPAAL